MPTQEALDAALRAVSTLADKIATDAAAFEASAAFENEGSRAFGAYADAALKLSQAAANLVAIQSTLSQLERQRAQDEMARTLAQRPGD